ncbi:MAG: N-acetyl-gamma-glutamyl-phosphate reductase [Cenarchaeum sp. SB0665_bin_23]|nr:N-acetyl-gamma-glutamyl-phosphate reductase [Cenarchaeum sp. SB0667_bin_13]MXY61536.1 N-acetyl-gamma-glutamyl-phosphate reductase [Cenarchaeum sp. SB0665_bin_23]MXZ94202.1 N-acetyl-gamma-glutamyl-phosphate reductase [Cenarchaeum sp. SB0666_bin_15]MYB46795.1 N-acetyl-gamma-glutamyl-phosphate reductase [Cenarchaeum sp. SB0662_bin_33]MYC80416.1 N-acetyl-gamma-glutamyl-phosphate reductase [Cenarchaeum sp. SB0661_bin_35]MYD58193.1 N-acetyl-gamma-glutamyl-phosphate reductase [Cenarchaeum sp. SB06
MRVGVIGASGYVGGEVLRLLVNHPDVEITAVTSRKHAGQYLHRIQPSLKGFTDLTFSELDYDRLSEKCDLIITAVPHGSATEIVKAFYDRGIRIIDLSADYRLHNPQDYAKWYGWEHPHPEYLEKSVFGVPELHRDEIRDAQLVSCPGCMAVTSTLALAPLIKNDIIDTKYIVVDSKIGSSGAGAGAGTSHAMRAGVIRPYKPSRHRHTGEIEQELSALAGSTIQVSMSPHAVDVVRGILCTNHTFLKKETTTKDLWRIYRETYGSEKFVRLIRDQQGLYKFPDPKFLVGSNFCDIGFDVDTDNNRLIVMSASDNLMKGAAGSAIQNLNVMHGLDEMAGLRYTPLTPV